MGFRNKIKKKRWLTSDVYYGSQFLPSSLFFWEATGNIVVVTEAVKCLRDPP